MITGIQVSSLKPLLLTPEQVRTACAHMKALGSHTLQLQWIHPSVPLQDIANALTEHGLHSVSVQDFYETVAADPDYYMGLNQITGGTWLCVSRIPDHLKTPEGLDIFVSQLRRMQKTLDPLGQQLCFHPVSADYTAIPGMQAVEMLLERMPELMLCLDLYHLNRNCSDMPGFIRKYAGRICMVHFKDSKDGQLVPAGSGDTDWTGVVRACLDARVPYAFVEQEQWAADPYLCLGQALQWLNTQIQPEQV